MRWCVIRHPDLGEAVVAEPSLTVHRPRGWVRVSPYTTDRDSLRPDEYPDLTDLDADDTEPAADTDTADNPPKAAKTTKATAKNRGDN